VLGHPRVGDVPELERRLDGLQESRGIESRPELLGQRLALGGLVAAIHEAADERPIRHVEAERRPLRDVLGDVTRAAWRLRPIAGPRDKGDEQPGKAGDPAGGDAFGDQGLAAALAYCRKGDTFRVYSVDRLARSLSDLIAITTELTAKGVRVEAIKDGLVLDPNDPDPQSEFRLHLWGALAPVHRQRERVERRRDPPSPPPAISQPQ